MTGGVTATLRDLCRHLVRQRAKLVCGQFICVRCVIRMCTDPSLRVHAWNRCFVGGGGWVGMCVLSCVRMCIGLARTRASSCPWWFAPCGSACALAWTTHTSLTPPRPLRDSPNVRTLRVCSGRRGPAGAGRPQRHHCPHRRFLQTERPS